MKRNKSLRSFMDRWLLLLYLLLILLGWLNVFAANYAEGQAILSFDSASGRQLIWIGSALLMAGMCMMVEGTFYRQFAYFIFFLSVLMLIAVLVFGTEVKGARSWFSVGGILRIQPSEFAKFASSLALASLLSSYETRLIDLKTRLKAFAILLLPAALIALQPDPGSAIIFTAFIFVLYREGLSGKVLLAGMACAVLFVVTIMTKDTAVQLPFALSVSGTVAFSTVLFAIAAVIYLLIRKFKKSLLIVSSILLFCLAFVFSANYVFDHALKTHQQNRILELLGKKYDPKGTGYNVNQSKIAIGSGGLTGKGFLQGTQTKFDFVPEQTTDFIFCTVGEEWGFAGSCVVVMLFTALFFRILIVAERQRSKFSRIYGYCVASLLFFHFAINIGMTIGFAPVIGIPLPFFSYGGSSLWAFTILLFVFIRIDAERMRILR